MNYNSHPKMKYLYIGVDCHKYTHTATMINCFNEKLATITFDNTKKGYTSLLNKVNLVKETLIPIFALEDTKHLGYGLSNYLLTNNYLVKHVNSHLTANERKKHPTITKNDELDSSCIAKVLFDEFDNLPNAENEEIYWTLKQLVKMRNSIIKNNIELKNKLHAQLLHHYPNYNKAFVDIGKPTALFFFEKYPSPNLLNGISEEELAEVIHKNTKSLHYKTTSKNVMELIESYDIQNKSYQEERNNIIKLLIKQIINNKSRIKEIEEDIISLYNKTGKKIHTIPCVSVIYAASILAEIGNINRFSSSSKLARYAGIAPIEKSSGGKDHSMKCEYGNRTLNSLIYYISCIGLSVGRTMTTNPKAHNPIFKEYYYKKISEGKTKHQAIICIMRRLINIIYKILKEDKEYESPEKLVKQCKESFRERIKTEEEKLKKKQEEKEKHTKIKNLQCS